MPVHSSRCRWRCCLRFAVCSALHILTCMHACTHARSIARCLAAPQLRVNVPTELVSAGAAGIPDGSAAVSLAAGQRTLPRANLVVHGGDLCYPSPTGALSRKEQVAEFGMAYALVDCGQECRLSASLPLCASQTTSSSACSLLLAWIADATPIAL